jgi:hypothetical protein
MFFAIQRLKMHAYRGYVSIFRRKYGEKQTRKGVVYFQIAPKVIFYLNDYRIYCLISPKGLNFHNRNANGLRK